jgi:hypothetical protein
METPGVKESILLKGEDWKKVRSEVLPQLAATLEAHFPRTWIKVGTLFNEETLPEGTSKKSFSAAFWKDEDQQIQGTFVYKGNNVHGWSVLLRHPFGNSFCLQARSGTEREAVEYSDLVNEAVRSPPSSQKPLQAQSLEITKNELKRLLSADTVAIPSPQKKPPAVTPATSVRKLRSDTIIDMLDSSQHSYRAFKQLSASDQVMAFNRLMSNSRAAANASSARIDDENDNKDNEDSNKKVDALSLISLFDMDSFSRRSFIARISQSADVRQSGHLFPRVSGGFGDLSDADKGNITSTMIDVAKMAAEALMSVHDAPLLLNSMIQKRSFTRYVMPTAVYNPEGYDEFTRNPVVKMIKAAIEKLGKSNYNRRIELMSLLEHYPDAWQQKFLGVGRMTTTDARDHASAFAAGLEAPKAARKSFTRNRRVGAIEDFFMEWIHAKENTESSPEVKRNTDGVLVNQRTNYRILNRNRGYAKYKRDAEEENQPYYSKASGTFATW